jgi:2-polyprenyl-6-methoxyphenol hydroxylase-like FAD-dependent oxidoreductase
MKVLVIGGGIGGFATALSLHAAGIECEVFEQSRGIRELGVGVNLLPHAVKELANLGLLDELDQDLDGHIWEVFYMEPSAT